MANKWFAATLGFLIPPLAFVYLAKLRVAALCFLLLVCFKVADYYFSSPVGFSILALLFSVVVAKYTYDLAIRVEYGSDRKWYSHWWGTLSIPMVFFSILLLVRIFVAEFFSIPSVSMSPTLEVGDHIVVKKWGYGTYGAFGFTLANSPIEDRVKPQRGEVVVIMPPFDPGQFFVKRVIGLPGDLVEFSNKQLMINGSPIDTENIGNGVFKEAFGETISTVKYTNDSSQLRSGKWAVPEDHYFVLGDNRDFSADSRVWGMLPGRNILGRVIVKW